MDIINTYDILNIYFIQNVSKLILQYYIDNKVYVLNDEGNPVLFKYKKNMFTYLVKYTKTSRKELES